MFRHVNKLIRTNLNKPLRFSSEAAPNKNLTPEVKKETYFQQWGRFWRFLYIDYKDVVLQTIKDSKAKPRKAVFYLGAIAAIGFAMNTNPGEKSYRELVLESSDDLILVSDKNRNSITEAKLKFIHSCYNEGIIRYMNLGVLSFIWLDNFSSECGVYPSQCSYLKPGLLDFHNRVLDVGFLGKWWSIRSHMKNFDISLSEFPT